MNAEALRVLLRRQPFEPFEVRMTNGETHQVRHPENALVTGSRMVIDIPETDRMIILSLLHVAAVEMVRSAA